ncbi:NUDIX hydrolase [Kitasatospora sp. NPDC058965]|uniref:NUDIX hydrolase n=1 Tax=Kitasatospora sp. NPDC058965 TaxID=3346682 RepID=UPI0036BCE62D
MDRYAQLRSDRPELFRNDPEGIQILTDPAESAEAERAVCERGGGAPVAAAQSGVVYADPYVTVLRDPVRFPGGGLGLHLRLLDSSGVPGVVVLPVLPDGVLLVEHYRHASRSWHLEAPRGYGEPDADGERNARRELSEELGAQAEELVPLGPLYPDTGLMAGHTLLYAARVVGHGAVQREEGIRRAVRLGFAEAEQLVAEGRISCGFTVAVLYRARLAGLLGQ